MRNSLPDLLHQLGYAVRAFPSAEAFLEADCIDYTHCLIVDVATPGMSGFALSRDLKGKGYEIPMILMMAETDDDPRRQWMGSGLVKCLVKPYGEAALSPPAIASHSPVRGLRSHSSTPIRRDLGLFQFADEPAAALALCPDARFITLARNSVSGHYSQATTPVGLNFGGIAQTKG